MTDNLEVIGHVHGSFYISVARAIDQAP